MTVERRKMEEEAASDFKSIRAKFLETQVKDRPAVPEKPKRLPPPGGRSNLFMSSINAGVDNKTPVLPRVIFRDNQKVPVGKRPVSFPTQLLHATPPHLNGGATGDGVTKQAFKDRHLPLVLPVLPTKEPKHVPPPKGVPSPVKCKKKALSFKSTKASKVQKETVENVGENNMVTNPVEGSILEISTMENSVHHHEESSNPESQCASPEVPATPSPVEMAEDSSVGGGVTPFFDQHVMSTLEKAKKRFSPKHLLVYARPKSFHSSRDVPAAESPPPPIGHKYLPPELDSPLPESLCYSQVASLYAPRPFKVNSTSHGQENGWKVNGGRLLPDWPNLARPPPIKPLPDLVSLGPSPPKPPRPPRVDLRCYPATTIDHGTTNGAISQEFVPDEEAQASQYVVPDEPPLQDPEFDAPEFPDFENSQLEIIEANAMDLAALELEATKFRTPEPTGFQPVPVEMNGLDLQALSLLDRDLGPSEPVPAPPEEPVTHELWAQAQAAPVLEDEDAEVESVEPAVSEVHVTDLFVDQERPSEPSLSQKESYYETCDNVYEDVENVGKFHFGQSSRKRKGAPKNPYVDKVHVKEETRKNIWHITPWSGVTGEHSGLNHTHGDRKERCSPENHDEKDQRKKEKQRLEKEKKEQKEREKKENEMKKKFKITGLEEPMYHAKVMVASKVRKHDLPVQSGDTVSIIRTTNCPKAKWLARDADHKYGYISVMNVELNIKEMKELGKRVQAAGRSTTEGDTVSVGSRSSNHNPVLTSSFTDDSEEWTCDEETLSPTAENMIHNRAVSMPEMLCAQTSVHPTLSDGSMEDIHTQARHVALQKLAIFFQHTKEDDLNDAAQNEESTPTNTEDPGVLCAVEEPPYPEEDDFHFADMELLPPPELYADTM